MWYLPGRARGTTEPSIRRKSITTACFLCLHFICVYVFRNSHHCSPSSVQQQGSLLCSTSLLTHLVRAETSPEMGWNVRNGRWKVENLFKSLTVFFRKKVLPLILAKLSTSLLGNLWKMGKGLSLKTGQRDGNFR